MDVWVHLVDFHDPSPGFMEGSEIRFSCQKINLAAVGE